MYKIYQLLDALQVTGADNSQWCTVSISEKYGNEFDMAEVLRNEFGEGEIADGVIIDTRYFVVWKNTDLYEHISRHTLIFPSCAYKLKNGDAVLLYSI